MTDYAVTFKQVDKYFQNGTQKVLHQMTAEIPKGVILTLVGPSGSGKSTLLSLCNLMLAPDHGEVFIDGKEVRDWNVNELRKYVGLAFQTPTMLPGTVEDNLMLAARLHQVELQDAGKRLEYVGLPTSLLTRNAAELSGGQKQRVALARTLVNPTSILLLDEVTSALDVSAAREIEQLIVNIQKQEKKTVLWVTHDLEQAKRVGDITWLLVDGELVEATDTQTFFQQPKKEITRRFLKGEWSE